MGKGEVTALTLFYLVLFFYYINMFFSWNVYVCGMVYRVAMLPLLSRTSETEILDILF